MTQTGIRHSRENQYPRACLVWQTQGHPSSPLPSVQREVFRASRHGSFRFPTAIRESRFHSRTRRRRQWNAKDRSVSAGRTHDRQLLYPTRRRSRRNTPRRTRRLFPPTPKRFNSTRSGVSSQRRNNIATQTIRLMLVAAITGIILRWMPNINSCFK